MQGQHKQMRNNNKRQALEGAPGTMNEIKSTVAGAYIQCVHYFNYLRIQKDQQAQTQQKEDT
jgi:hypothetical protein